ncbi:MAG: hypothetical protein ABI824_10385 [Acidobacteriota bacterium]
MRLRILAVALFCSVLLAQEGHPMKGTWHGNFGANEKDRTPITLVMDWDGKNVTGIMNPGLRVAKIEKASLDPSNWMFHFEADYKDRAGTTSHLVVDAKIKDVTNPRRQLVGTFTQGTLKGDFKAARDN